jgi:hypothetical protein
MHRIVAKMFEGSNDETLSEHIDGRNRLRFSTIEQFGREVGSSRFRSKLLQPPSDDSEATLTKIYDDSSCAIYRRGAQYSGRLLPWATAQTVITVSFSE